jgi:hypothetical protein
MLYLPDWTWYLQRPQCINKPFMHALMVPHLSRLTFRPIVIVIDCFFARGSKTSVSQLPSPGHDTYLKESPKLLQVRVAESS